MMIEDRNGIAAISTDDRLDAVVAHKFKDEVNQLAERGKTRIGVDPAKTRFIDSSGLGMLVAALSSVLRKNGEMKLARPSEQANSLLRLTRLDQVFQILDDADEAITSFGDK